jgi:hypothetical protein
MAQRLGLHDAIVYHNANQPVRNWPGHRTAVGWIDNSRPCAPDSSQELEVEPEIQTDGEMAETRSDIYSWGHNLSPSHQSPPIQADLMPKPRDSAIQTDMMPKLKDTVAQTDRPKLQGTGAQTDRPRREVVRINVGGTIFHTSINTVMEGAVRGSPVFQRLAEHIFGPHASGFDEARGAAAGKLDWKQRVMPAHSRGRAGPTRVFC